MTDVMKQDGEEHLAGLELGKILGQRKAFALMAGRCSAEQAAALKQMRDGKIYESVTPTWDEFCTRELRMSRVHANRIIKWFEEFGQAYFEMAQLTRVSPNEYRQLAPVIVDHQLLVDGKAIALIPEKAEEVAAAVTQMRLATPNRAAASTKERLESLEKQCTRMASAFEELSAKTPPEERVELAAVLAKHLSVLARIESSL